MSATHTTLYLNIILPFGEWDEVEDNVLGAGLLSDFNFKCRCQMSLCGVECQIWGIICVIDMMRRRDSVVQQQGSFTELKAPGEAGL